ncbi:MAG: Ig-like domain-containing protein, partial [Methanobrevibacter sp.]|nr:Ig-like domain-containing protein [Methanobrevibacter sp.]
NTVPVKDGIAACTFTNLTAGDKIINVKHDGDANYAPSQNAKSIVVSKINPDINISSSDITYGQNIKVQIDLNKDATGNVIVSVGDASQIANTKDGSASVEFSDIGAGVKTIKVVYDGDDNYLNASESKSVNVAKSESEINVSVSDIDAGEDLNITVQLNNRSTGNVIISVGDASRTVPVKNGIAEASFDNLDAGNYSVDVSYSGDANFNSSSYRADVEVKAVAPAMDVVVPEEIKAGENPEITFELPKDATGSIQVSLDGKVVGNASVVNGTAKFTLDNIAPGNHTLTVAYSGDGKYAPFSKDAAVNCMNKTKKGAVIVVVDKFTRVANDYSAGERGNFFYAVLQDLDGNPLVNKTVQIAVNGPIYEVQTDQYGRAGLQINLAAANTYTYALFFGGDSEYAATPLASSKLVLTKKSTSISASAKTFKAKSKTKTVKVTLKTIKSARDGKTYLKAGKKITLKVGGKTYTAKINKNGVAKFNIKLTKKGKYTAKITFAGDKTYKASSKSIKITIK